MSGKYAILIDAGFLKRKLGSQERPLSANRVVQFTNTLRERPELTSAKLHRIYYYTEISVTATDLIPNVQQKGVDMRIGLDIASLSLKNHVDIIALVTGDSDFVPALKFARREGKQIFVYTLGHSVLPDIITHSDICITATAECL